MPGSPIILSISRSFRTALNSCSFCDSGQFLMCISLADTSGHMSILGQCIFQQITYHGILIFLSIFRINQEIMNQLKCLLSVIIVCIDHRKRSVHNRQTGQDSMSGSPWFYTAFRHLKAFWQVVKILKYILHRNPFLHTVSNALTEICFIFLLDNKYDFSKSSLYCIVDRIVHNNMSLGINGVNLFQSAVTASHTCRHND